MHTVGKWHVHMELHTHIHGRMSDCHLCWVPLARVHHSWALPATPAPTPTTPWGFMEVTRREMVGDFDTSGPIPDPSRPALYDATAQYGCSHAGLTAVTHKLGYCNRIPHSWCNHSNETPLLRGNSSPKCFQLSWRPNNKPNYWCMLS